MVLDPNSLGLKKGDLVSTQGGQVMRIVNVHHRAIHMEYAYSKSYEGYDYSQSRNPPYTVTKKGGKCRSPHYSITGIIGGDK